MDRISDSGSEDVGSTPAEDTKKAFISINAFFTPIFFLEQPPASSQNYLPVIFIAPNRVAQQKNYIHG